MNKQAKRVQEIFLQIEEREERDDVEVHLAKELRRPSFVKGRTIPVRLERALLVLIDLDEVFTRAVQARALFRVNE